jgi:hypothetical protein
MIYIYIYIHSMHTLLYPAKQAKNCRPDRLPTTQPHEVTALGSSSAYPESKLHKRSRGMRAKLCLYPSDALVGLGVASAVCDDLGLWRREGVPPCQRLCVCLPIDLQLARWSTVVRT